MKRLVLLVVLSFSALNIQIYKQESLCFLLTGFLYPSYKELGMCLGMRLIILYVRPYPLCLAPFPSSPDLERKYTERAWYLFSHELDVIGKELTFSEDMFCTLFIPLYVQYSVCRISGLY